MHFQVELCIAAILSHAAREEQAEAGGSDGKAEPLPGSGDGNGKLETAPSITSPPENAMVTHVSPGLVELFHLQPALHTWVRGATIFDPQEHKVVKKHSVGDGEEKARHCLQR